MNVVIIEEEKKTANKVSSLLLKIDPLIKVAAVLETVNESVCFLQDLRQIPDLIFCGINLPDGVSFSIFKSVSIPTPIVFITAFDVFMMKALEHNGIDYIPKPINENDIRRALLKYRKLQKHFLNNTTITQFIKYLNTSRKTRLIVKWGTDNIALPISEIALFYTRNKVVYAMDKCGKKYIIDKTMSELECVLHKKHFFRANRQYLVSLNYIKGFNVYERVKIELNMSIPEFEEVVIISQETAPLFKSWISKA